MENSEEKPDTREEPSPGRTAPSWQGAGAEKSSTGTVGKDSTSGWGSGEARAADPRSCQCCGSESLGAAASRSGPPKHQWNAKCVSDGIWRRFSGTVHPCPGAGDACREEDLPGPGAAASRGAIHPAPQPRRGRESFGGSAPILGLSHRPPLVQQAKRQVGRRPG